MSAPSSRSSLDIAESVLNDTRASLKEMLEELACMALADATDEHGPEILAMLRLVQQVSNNVGEVSGIIGRANDVDEAAEAAAAE